MGLVIFGVMALYLVLAIFVVTGAISHARKQGKSVKRWGWGAALVIYLIPFWDWIPTVAVHQYYCATEAGFWVYKTPEQWMKENPGVMETLVAQQSIQSTTYGDLQTMDERFSIETHRSKPIEFLPTGIAKRLLIDRKTGDVLAQGVDVGSGVGNIGTDGGVKFWLNQNPCVAKGFFKVVAEIENMRRQK